MVSIAALLVVLALLGALVSVLVLGAFFGATALWWTRTAKEDRELPP